MDSHIEVSDVERFRDMESCRNLTYVSFWGISRIEFLPSSIGKLRQLQVLDLRACHNLEELGEFEGCRLTSGLRLPASQTAPASHPCAMVAKPLTRWPPAWQNQPPKPPQGVRCLVLQSLECRKPGFIVGGLS